MVFLQCLEVVGNVPYQIYHFVLLSCAFAYEVYVIDYA